MDNFYYPNICHICKNVNRNTKRCSNCKLFSYCSKNHQKLDWSHHKHICKALKELKFTCEPNCSYTDYTAKRLHFKLLLETKLNRQLNRYESQLCFFPQVCNVCFQTVNLKPCEICLTVSYCSAEHEKCDKVHLEYCKLLKLAMFCDIYNFKHGIFIPNLQLSKIPMKFKTLPEDFLDLLTNREMSKEETIDTLTWDCFAPGATIIHALERSKIIKNREHDKNSLTLHFVGANDYETYLNWELLSEFLFHWITNLKLIHIVLIGPELNVEIPHLPNNFCPDCKENKSTLEMHKTCYHNIVKQLQKPDIVIGFNSGLHEYQNSEKDSWKLSLKSLINHGVPLLLTAYTEEEIKKDLQRLTKVDSDFKVLENPERNPYSNRRPLRDWSSNLRPIFYINGFYTILMS